MADADGTGWSHGPGLCCRCAAWRGSGDGEAVRQTGLLRRGDPRDRIPAERRAAGCIGQGEPCRAVVRSELVAVGRALDTLRTWSAGKDRSRRSCGCGAPTAGCEQKADQRYKYELISRQDGTTLQGDQTNARLSARRLCASSAEAAAVIRFSNRASAKNQFC